MAYFSSMVRMIGILLLVLSSAFVSQAQTDFSKAELAVFTSKKEHEPLTVLKTTNKADSLLLRQIALPVNVQDAQLPLLIKKMQQTVSHPDNDGVGIAAPQIGINIQLFLIQRFDKANDPFQVFINPTIYWTSNLIQTGNEGCLSIPDITGMVDRYYAIGVQYQDEKGQWHKEILEGFTAIIFQHEFDHINGVLFVDRLLEQSKRNYKQPKQSYKWLSEKNTR